MRYILKGSGDILLTNARGFEWLNRWSKENPQKSVQKKRYFCINTKIYRKVAGAVKELFLIKKHNLTFWTFTSPENINHSLYNKIMSDFNENLKKNYELKNYVGVAERQERGAIHYHFIYDIPFVDIELLTDYYINLGRRYGVTFESNSIRLPPNGAIVKSQKKLVQYVCKYMTKSKDEHIRYDAKCYFITHALNRKDIEISEEEYKLLMHDDRIIGQTFFEHLTVSHTTLYFDVYDYFRKQRQKERLIYDDFMVKEQNRRNLMFQQTTKTLKLDLFGDIAEENNRKLLEKIREDEYKELEFAILKDERYRKWKEQHIKKTEDTQKKDRKPQTETIERTQNERTYRELYDRDTGEFVRLYQWFKKDCKKKTKKTEFLLQFSK